MELFNLLTAFKLGLLQTEAAIKKYVDSKNGRPSKNSEKLRSLMKEVMVQNTFFGTGWSMTELLNEFSSR